MKKIPFPFALFLLLFIVSGCDQCKNKCDKEVSIEEVQPKTNPAGYEVLLKATGFTNNAKVIFGNVEASSRGASELAGIIATVPNGLAGNVEISVEEGDCIARSSGFVVSGSLPSNVQPSLPEIVLPIPLPQLSIPPAGFQNNWVNAASGVQANFGIHLNGDFNGSDVSSLDQSYEFNYNDANFDDNPATGTATRSTNVIYLEVDRTAKGGSVEHFDGLFIQVPAFLPANAKYAVLLTSRETGRQMLLYYPE